MSAVAKVVGCLLVGVLSLSVGALAEAVTVPIVCELSGPGAPSGMRWEGGVLMAAEEINAAGGIQGAKIETFSLDTKTEAPVSIAAKWARGARRPHQALDA